MFSARKSTQISGALCKHMLPFMGTASAQPGAPTRGWRQCRGAHPRRLGRPSGEGFASLHGCMRRTWREEGKEVVSAARYAHGGDEMGVLTTTIYRAAGYDDEHRTHNVDARSYPIHYEDLRGATLLVVNAPQGGDDRRWRYCGTQSNSQLSRRHPTPYRKRELTGSVP